MNKNATKRSLLASVLALVMCVAMLVGATFAWFTDTASTGVNKIVAGNLHVEIQNEAGQKIENLEWKTADGRAQADILWEPGCTYTLTPFKIVNTGNLALKYKIVVTGLEGNSKLLDVLTFTYKMGGEEYTLGTEGHLTAKGTAGAVSDVITVSASMDKDAGNDYMDKTLDGVRFTVVATQDTVESDSTDNQYDAEAAYPVVDAANLADTLNALEDNATITVSGTVTEELTISKPVTIYNLKTTAPVTVKSDGVKLNAASITSTEASTPAITVDKTVSDVAITNSVITAKTGKAGTHTAVSLPVSGKVVFSGNTVTNDYNGIEFGLNVPVSDGTVIENNNFVNIGNNAISIYQVEDGATVTIKNNTFTGKAGDFIPVRLSNSNNQSGTFVLSGNNVDTDNSWINSFVMLEDYSKAGATQDFTKYTLKFSDNTVGAKCTYVVVFDDDVGIISANQPTVVK